MGKNWLFWTQNECYWTRAFTCVCVHFKSARSAFAFWTWTRPSMVLQYHYLLLGEMSHKFCSWIILVNVFSAQASSLHRGNKEFIFSGRSGVCVWAASQCWLRYPRLMRRRTTRWTRRCCSRQRCCPRAAVTHQSATRCPEEVVARFAGNGRWCCLAGSSWPLRSPCCCGSVPCQNRSASFHTKPSAWSDLQRNHVK